jgi:NADH-quinone oxidoreductase subunit J
MELFAFIVLAVLAIVSAAVVILHRNQVVAALALAGNLIAIAGFYLVLQAQFLALLQVIVYAGAIMVLILFVLMLLNLPEESRRARDPGRFQAGLGVVLAAAFVAVMGWAVFRAAPAEPFPAPSETFGTVASVGMSLFREYFYAFEAISLLLVVAMVGAVVLAKRRI